jgi:hypothetical protein
MPWITIVAVAFFFAAYLWLLMRSGRYAAQRRRRRLVNREPIAFTDWQASVPNASANGIHKSLEIFELVLDVPHQFLRPSDEFTKELSLADRFFCFVIDDDTTEEICDKIEEYFGTGFQGDWENLGDMVVEVSQNIET